MRAVARVREVRERDSRRRPPAGADRRARPARRTLAELQTALDAGRRPRRRHPRRRSSSPGTCCARHGGRGAARPSSGSPPARTVADRGPPPLAGATRPGSAPSSCCSSERAAAPRRGGRPRRGPRARRHRRPRCTRRHQEVAVMSVTDVSARIQPDPGPARAARTARLRVDGSVRRRVRRRPGDPARPPATTAAHRRPAASPATAVVAEAKKYLGVPYVWGGTDPKKGLDCSGPRAAGLQEPRQRPARASPPSRRPPAARSASMAEAQPGDLIAWDNSSRNNGVDHIAIYIGDGKMIEAPRTGLDVPHRRRPETPDVDPPDPPRGRRSRPPRSPAARRVSGAARRTPTCSAAAVAEVRRRRRRCSPPWPGRSPASTRGPSAPPAPRGSCS